jgi:hypothetical protein
MPVKFKNLNPDVNLINKSAKFRHLYESNLTGSRINSEIKPKDA